MANFLITAPNEATTGTSTADVVIVQTAGVLGGTVFGAEGNDLISAANAGNGVNTKFNGGLGADTINLGSSATYTVAKVFAGGDNDLITAGASAFFAAGTVVNGGGGADTVLLAAGANISASTINGNGGKDYISATQLSASNTFLGLGGGADTLILTTATLTTATIAAGGGADLISAASLSAVKLHIEGDTVGDTEFYGNDTIRIAGGDVGVSALIQGGGGADSISLTASVGTASTINGNAGKDVITLISAGGTATNALIGGGAGSDTITISAVIVTANGSTVFGGGGADIIDVSAAATGGALQLVGGEGADTFSLGASVSAGATSVNIRYTSFAESNLGTYDYVSATAARESSFVISQSVVSASTAASVNAGGDDGVITSANGVFTSFGANVGGDVTARTTVLDTYLSEGQVATFTDGSGNDYLFVQAGAAGSGTDGDLLIQSNTLITGFSIKAGTAMEISMT